MALEDYPFVFNPIVVLDPSTGYPAQEVTVQLRATPEGAALDIGDMTGNPLNQLKTSELGILPAHRTTVSRPYVWAGGSITLQEVAVELMNSLAAAQAAQAAAEAAAAIVDAWDPETSGFLTEAQRGQPGGVASLNASGTVPAAQLPTSGTPDLLNAGPIVQEHTDSDTASRWQTEFTGTLDVDDADIAQHLVNGVRVAWLNEWGAMRGTSPYPGGDALVRGVRSEGDGIIAGRALEIVDRQVGAGTNPMWGRKWRDGMLVRNGIDMADVHVLSVGDPVPDELPSGSVIVEIA